MPDTAREVRTLLGSGLARNEAHALEIIAAAEERQKRADLFVFFMDLHAPREALREYLVGERPYNSSTARVATIPSGALGKLSSNSTLAIGALKEFAPRPDDQGHAVDDEAKLVAIIRDFPFRGKSGIFLTPFSGEAVRARGKQTVDEREDLYRIEFKPIAGDFVLGIFHVWNKVFQGKTALLLYMSRSSVLVL